MCLKQGHTEPCNISGSPYSIQRLILAQSLYAYLGTADHRKRKRTEEQVQRAGKRQRTEGSINLSGVVHHVVNFSFPDILCRNRRRSGNLGY